MKVHNATSTPNQIDIGLLQDRVRLYLKVLFLIHMVFVTVSVVQLLLGIQTPGDPDELAVAAQQITMWSITGLIGLGWLYVVRGGAVRAVLHAMETLGTVLVTAAYIHVLLVVQVPEGRLFSLLLVSLALVLRASLIPSSVARTLAVGLLGVGGAMAGSLATSPSVEPIQHVWLAVVGLAFVGVTTVTSSVIYGLRREVLAARRLGQYELQRKIGEGGMGVVYEATHVLLKRPTAVKLLPVEKAGEQTIARFEREVRETSRLDHPNSVTIYDYGHTPDGQFYYAMEYLDGLNLQQLVVQDGPLSGARASAILLQAAHALAEAHGKGLVHRDIKPANIMLCDRGGVPDTVKVLDFGLVKAVGMTGTDHAVTQVNTIVGTPHYLAPEAFQDPGTVGPAADVYALGAVGFFLLAGREAFEGKSIVEVCSKHLNETPVPPSTFREEPVAGGFEAILMRCLEKEPRKRFADGGALADALESLPLEGWGAREARAWWRLHRPAPTSPVSPPVIDRTQLTVDIETRFD